ncbi:hypothetical protein D3C72_2489250 [compost metagenome]
MNNVLNKSITLTGAYEIAADMDYSGSISISDLSRMNQYLTGSLERIIKINN